MSMVIDEPEVPEYRVVYGVKLTVFADNGQALWQQSVPAPGYGTPIITKDKGLTARVDFMYGKVVPAPLRRRDCCDSCEVGGYHGNDE